MMQMQRSSKIAPERNITPNSLDQALQPSHEAQVIIDATYPYGILHVNDAWTAENNLSQSAVEGFPLMKLLNAYEFQSEMVHKFAYDCSRGFPGSRIYLSKAQLIYYIKMLPLWDGNNQLNHILVTLINIPLSADEKKLLLGDKSANDQINSLINTQHQSLISTTDSPINQNVENISKVTSFSKDIDTGDKIPIGIVASSVPKEQGKMTNYDMPFQSNESMGQNSNVNNPYNKIAGLAGLASLITSSYGATVFNADTSNYSNNNLSSVAPPFVSFASDNGVIQLQNNSHFTIST
jgi:hypothetical protein